MPPAPKPAELSAGEKAALDSKVAQESVLADAVAAVTDLQALYDQVAAIDAQMITLRQQRSVLQAQTEALETDDIRKTRAVIKVLDMVATGNRRFLRDFGL